MSYTLECDEPMYVRTKFNEEMERVEERPESSSGLDMNNFWYWIESDDSEKVLSVNGFMEAERILLQLSDGELEDLQDAHEENKDLTELREDRPPY